MSDSAKISFIGFGEAAQAFSRGLLQDSAALILSAYDIKTDGPDASAKRAEYKAAGVMGCASCDEASADAAVIFSLVTADKAEAAASSVARAGLNGALFLDCNSCAPSTKGRSAKIVEAAGGRYVDVAVMTPVYPRLHKSPCLVAGPHAQAAAEMMQSLGMTVDIAGDQIGDASSRKMIRSVMIKGLEALTLECFLAARKAGIEEDILATLEASFADFAWADRAPYMMERVATHGTRRAAEMEEVVKTLSDLGIDPHITRATVIRQREVGALNLTLNSQDAHVLADVSDTILNGLGPQMHLTTEE